MKVLSLSLLTLLTSCALLSEDVDVIKNLTLLDSYHLSVPEPSGLTFDPDHKTLVCVSDPPENRAFEISLTGNIQRALAYEGQDLEGISYDPTTHRYWVVDEFSSQLIQLDSMGQPLLSLVVDYDIPDVSDGLEGVCYRPARQDLFLVKQKKPAAIIHLDSNLVTVGSQTLDFARDLTGICEGRAEDEFLLISSEEKRLYEWSWDSGVLASYSFEVDQAEGVAYDPELGVIYIVCDRKAKLYSFKFPG